VASVNCNSKCVVFYLTVAAGTLVEPSNVQLDIIKNINYDAFYNDVIYDEAWLTVVNHGNTNLQLFAHNHECLKVCN